MPTHHAHKLRVLYAQNLQQLQLDFVMADSADLTADILYGLNRIAAIVSGLKLFSDEQNTGSQLVNLTQLVEQAVTLCLASQRDECSVSIELPDVLTINGSAAELLQINVVGRRRPTADGIDLTGQISAFHGPLCDVGGFFSRRQNEMGRA